jgi:hypothetical protein
MQQVEKIFKKLPKPLRWHSFYNNDLPLAIDFCKMVQEVSIQNGLSGAQTRALDKLKSASTFEFQRLTVRGKRFPRSEMGHGSKDSSQTSLREMSAREIDSIADKAVKKKKLKELNLKAVWDERYQKVIYETKDAKTSKIFYAPDWLARLLKPYAFMTIHLRLAWMTI